MFVVLDVLSEREKGDNVYMDVKVWDISTAPGYRSMSNLKSYAIVLKTLWHL